ncbi:MAG: ABC transporter substrate-binding protein [Pseudomonadota bacterium]
MLDRISVCLAILVGLAACTVQACLAADNTVRVHIDQAIQPFALPASGSGLQADIFQAAFATQLVQTEFVFLPGARSWREYNAGRIDVITNAKQDSELKVVLTHWPVLSFKNQAISLKSKQIKLESIDDLAKFRVVAFQNASKFLGVQYATMARHNKSYSEQSTMPSFMLQMDSTDVIVSQADIFRYNLIENGARLDFKPEFDQFEYHDIFGKGNDYWLGFRSEVLRDQFERGIAAIYNSGEIDKIFDRYEAKYGTTRDMFIHLDCRFLKQRKPARCGLISGAR